MGSASHKLSEMIRAGARWRPGPDVIDRTREACLGIRELPRQFVFNADLDGVLSAHLLDGSLGWTAVGASACSGVQGDCLWLAAGPLGTEVVFVDLWVAPPEYAVIDQHIVAVDRAHADRLRGQRSKINPNLLWVRTAETDLADQEWHYKWKYPFGVVHFLIAALESIGESVRIPDAQLHGSASVIDLVLRADDAARSTAGRYRSNALGWWDYLCSVGGATTRVLAERACFATEAEAMRRQADVERWIGTCGHRHAIRSIGGDAGLSKHLSTVGWSGGVDDAIETIGIACGFSRLAPHDRWIARSLRGERSDSSKPRVMLEALARPDLFSYAVTARFGHKASSGFSCSYRKQAGT